MSATASPLPVSVSGGYWTGSSAVVDLLEGHPDCQVVPEEFVLFGFGQMFEEVTSPLLRGEADPALVRANLARMRDFNRRDRFPRARGFARRILGPARVFPRVVFGQRRDMARRLGGGYADACLDLYRMLSDSACTAPVEPSVVSAAVRRVVDQAIRGARPPGAPEPLVGVYDQLVAPPYESCAREVLPGLKAIHVDRNWADQYLSLRDRYDAMARRNQALGIRPWGEKGPPAPVGPVEQFLALRGRIDGARAPGGGGNHTLWVTFEDVVLRTEATLERLCAFLGLDPGRWTPGPRWHPRRSRSRIGKPRPERLASEFAELAKRLGPPPLDSRDE